jgi:hypothetical protein
MTPDEIIEAAIQGHASTRDAIRWAIQQEREACAKVCERIGNPSNFDYVGVGGVACAESIRARGNT